MLGAYGRNVLNVNGKLLLGLAEEKKLAPLTTIFDPQMWRVPYFPKRQPHQRTNTLGYILTKQVDRRLIRIVNVRRLPLEVAPESDDNLVNTEVRFPCRSTRNRKKGESSKDPKTAHPRRYRVLPLPSRPPVPHAHVVRSSYPIPSILDNNSECDPLPSFASTRNRFEDLEIFLEAVHPRRRRSTSSLGPLHRQPPKHHPLWDP